MNWFGKVERYYKAGYYTNEQVKIFVQANKITNEEYREITSEDYIA